MSTTTGASADSGAPEPFRPFRLEFAHSTLTLEYGPAGVIGRLDYHDRPVRRYVGPLGEDTIAALEEVAEDV